MIYVHPTFRILIVIVTVITLFSIFDWLSDRPENDKITVKSENFTSYSITAKMSSEPKERTYIMVKPDGVERGLVGEIIKRFENKGYKLVALQLLPTSRELLNEHYCDLKDKPFFPKLINYMLSGPVVGMVWQGKDVVKTGRRLLGETDPLKSAPGTIRGDFCIDVGKNLCHGSDSVESAEREISLWFPNGVVSWERKNVHNLIYE